MRELRLPTITELTGGRQATSAQGQGTWALGLPRPAVGWELSEASERGLLAEGSGGPGGSWAQYLLCD